MTTIHDNFNRSNENPLGSSSEGWSWSNSYGGFAVVSNACQGRQVVDADRSYADTSLGYDDNYATFDFSLFTALRAYIYCRLTPGGDCYFAEIQYGSPMNIYLYKYVSGSATQIGSSTSSLSTTGNLYISAVGSTITVKVDGTTKISVTDTAVTSGKYAQIGAYNGWGAGLAVGIDNFEAGSIGGVGRRFFIVG